jgi:hypothetical protein
MRYLLIALFTLFFGICASAQTLTSTLTNTLPDSVTKWQGFRATGPMAVYGYNSTSGSSLMTGVGLAYTWQHLTTGGTWWVDEAAGLAFYAGGSQAPSSFALVTGVGPYVSFLNGYLSIGGVVNLTTGKPMLTVGVALPLISN